MSLEADAIAKGEAKARREVTTYLVRNGELYSPDGAAWCRFEAGSIRCVNDPCRNPRHRSVAVALQVSGRR